ncbi:MAG: hypothetical protein V7677_16365 [Motiliproteus sp.]
MNNQGITGLDPLASEVSGEIVGIEFPQALEQQSLDLVLDSGRHVHSTLESLGFLFWQPSNTQEDVQHSVA